MGVILVDGLLKVDKIKSVYLKPHEDWLNRRNRQNSSDNHKESFQQKLQQRMEKEEAKAVDTGEAAVWEGSNVTQSLFYQQGVNLDHFYQLRGDRA